MIQDNLELLVDLAQHKRSFWLEGAVLALIAIELLLAFFRHYGVAAGAGWVDGTSRSWASKSSRSGPEAGRHDNRRPR